MRRLLRLRLPLALTLAAVVQGIALATGSEYVPRPVLPRPGWLSPAVVSFLVAYLATTGVVGLWVCLWRLAGARRTARSAAAGLPASGGPAGRAPRRAGVSPAAPGRFWRVALTSPAGALRLPAVAPRHAAVAACLGAVVLLAGGAHLGERSGFWATSVPRFEMDPSTADGHVLWLDGVPQQEDSGPFISGLEVMSGGLPASAISGYARSGRTAYPYLVSLVAPVVGAVANVYAAFVVVNLLLWWGGALAVYDLTRRATGATWVGAVAGFLVATGIGFTFAAGNAMSTVAAYGAVPMVLWAMDRLGVLTGRARLGDDILSGCLAAGAGLLNSLAPFFLVFGACYYIGRSELRRLLLWAAVVLALGQAWSLRLGWAGRPAETPFLTGSVRVALAMAAGLLLLVGLARLPRRLGEGLVAGAVLGCAAVGLLLLLLAPGLVRTLAELAVAGLHLPEYIAANVLPLLFGGATGGWVNTLDDLRRGAFAGNLIAAFPGPVLWLAAAGLPRLPQRWRDWSLAVAVSAGLTTFVMDTVTSAPHPRLMFLAYPGVYLLAANGVANLYRLLTGVQGRLSWLPPRAVQAAAVAAVVVCVLASALPGQASLWGDWHYDLLFHFRNV